MHTCFHIRVFWSARAGPNPAADMALIPLKNISDLSFHSSLFRLRNLCNSLLCSLSQQNLLLPILGRLPAPHSNPLLCQWLASIEWANVKGWLQNPLVRFSEFKPHITLFRTPQSNRSRLLCVLYHCSSTSCLKPLDLREFAECRLNEFISAFSCGNHPNICWGWIFFSLTHKY